MTAALPLIRKLQAEATNPDASVTNLLRMAKVAATKLNLAEALVWIERELNGYMDLRVEDLPPYRRPMGIPQGYNPVHGWQPIQFPDTKTAETYSEAFIGIALGAIEKSVGEARGGSFAFPYGPEEKIAIRRSLNFPVDVRISIDRSQLWNIVDQVRNLILNWSLELEKAGVLGEDMHFSEQEKGEAEHVTQQFFIQNVGVLGNVMDQASVTNRQTATANVTLDLDQVRDFLAQAQTALPQLPKPVQQEVHPLLEAIDRELKKKEPMPGKIRTILGSLQKVVEGATGNLVAQGVITMVRAILGM
jgi:AbiTii